MRYTTSQNVFSSGRRFQKFVGPVIMMLALANAALAQTNSCDLDSSGAVNVVDVNRAVSMALGTVPCTASVEAQNTCTIITVQRVVNTALGQPCVVYNSAIHTVDLTWLPSPSVGVVGYNVYRSATPTGTPVKLNSVLITATSYTDTTIQLGQTYYYSATAVDNTGTESDPTTQAIAVIPTS
ncbi:MAG: hypothetical protein ABIR70_14415 [Bryobacteraceae bacterium]